MKTKQKIIRTWQGTCEDCHAWAFHDDGTGHCGLYSSECPTSILNKGKPTMFLSRYDVPVEHGGLEDEGE